MNSSKTQRVWTVAEAKAKLSEILMLAETEGPQRIGVRKSFVLLSAEVWETKKRPKKPMGQWLIENVPRGIDIEIPERHEPEREIPFMGDDTE